MKTTLLPLRFLSPLHRATRQISLYLEGQMKSLGVSNPEGHLLSYLLSYEPCPVGEIRRIFGLKGSTLTHRLDRLEANGLIVRHLHPTDRRSFLVELTDAGREVGARVREQLEALETQIAEQTGGEDLEGFANVMAAIAQVTAVELKEN